MKELFDTIPTPEDLCSLGMEGLRADIILVDADKDKKLTMVKQLSAALVKGATNRASLIKKIAGLVNTMQFIGLTSILVLVIIFASNFYYLSCLSKVYSNLRMLVFHGLILFYLLIFFYFISLCLTAF